MKSVALIGRWLWSLDVLRFENGASGTRRVLYENEQDRWDELEFAANGVFLRRTLIGALNVRDALSSREAT